MKRIITIFSNAILCVFLAVSGIIPARASQRTSHPVQRAAAASNIYLPVVMRDYFAPLPAIIPDTTIELTDETTSQISSISVEGSIFSFSSITPELEQVDVGDVIISGVSEAAPDGFLRKVTSRQTQAGGLVLTTEQATIEEAYEQVSVNLQQTLTPESLQGLIP